MILAKTLCGGAAMEVPLISGRDYPNTYRSFVEMLERAVATGLVTENDVTYGYNWG
jgi:hypothetical protein